MSTHIRAFSLRYALRRSERQPHIGLPCVSAPAGNVVFPYRQGEIGGFYNGTHFVKI